GWRLLEHLRGVQENRANGASAQSAVQSVTERLGARPRRSRVSRLARALPLQNHPARGFAGESAVDTREFTVNSEDRPESLVTCENCEFSESDSPRANQRDEHTSMLYE
ncbi:hypothetical protein DMN91_000709, partial [Ooceraea biroi]